jgi:integrase
MFLTKRANGIYYVVYETEEGRKKVSTHTTTKREAQQFLKNFYPVIEPAKKKETVKRISLKMFKYEYMRHSEAVHTEKTTKTFVTTFKYLESFLGGEKLVNEITEKDMLEFTEYRITHPSVYQARKDLINLSSAFNWAIQKEFLKTNPCNKIKRIKPPQKLPVFFSEKDFEKLISVILDQDFRAMVIVAVNTGLRQMELVNLRWYQVNINNPQIILDNQHHITKSKKIRSIPLNKKALDVILPLRGERGLQDCVFEFKGITNRWKYVQNNFRSYTKLAGVSPKLNFHSLRHTFASWLVQKGVSIYEVSKLLGHSDIKTTQIYAHLRGDDLKRAVDML